MYLTLSSSLRTRTWASLIPLFPILGPNKSLADDKLVVIACRSVHFAYEVPPSSRLMNSVKVRTFAPATCRCVRGFRQGYLGLQELDHGNEVVTFRVGDPDSRDDKRRA